MRFTGEADSNPPKLVIRTPLVPSVLAGIFALLIHPAGGVALTCPISFELQRGNVFAFMTLIALGWTLAVVAARFWYGRYFLSAAVCAACLALLVVIPCTEPRSELHNLAFAGLVVGSMGVFLLWALDTHDVIRVLPAFSPMALGLPFYAGLGVGGFQLLVIGSMLIALNSTFLHIEARDSF